MNKEQWYKEFLANDPESSSRAKLVSEATKDATAVFQKHFPNEKHNLEAPEVLAACLEMFDIGDTKDAGQLYLEWLVEHYVGRKVAANLNDVKTIVEALKVKGFIGDNAYHSGSKRLFYIPHPDKLIFCAEAPGRQFIYILTTDTFHPKFHIRQYYAWHVQSRRRPSLQYFEDCDFNPCCDDCENHGYVLYYEDLICPRAHGAIYNYSAIKLAFLQLRGVVGEMT